MIGSLLHVVAVCANRIGTVGPNGCRPTGQTPGIARKTELPEPSTAEPRNGRRTTGRQDRQERNKTLSAGVTAGRDDLLGNTRGAVLQLISNLEGRSPSTER